MLRAYGSTDKGPLRPTNEDYFGIDEHLGLCILADGMGGHNAGEVAARMAVDAVTEYLRLAILEGPGETPALRPFGSSCLCLIVISSDRGADGQRAILDAMWWTGIREWERPLSTLVSNGRLSVAHVGDSRLPFRATAEAADLR